MRDWRRKMMGRSLRQQLQPQIRGKFRRLAKAVLSCSLVVLICSLLGLGLGLGLDYLEHPNLSVGTPAALAAAAPPHLASNVAGSTEGTVDPITPEFQLGHELYLENCATCHVGIPPAVMPRQTWVELLQDSQHYGVQLQPLVDPGRLLVWQYLAQYSRSLNEEEAIPYRLRSSRFFKALHPRVDFDEPIRLTSCVSCHPAAPQFNYRRLSIEWQDAP